MADRSELSVSKSEEIENDDSQTQKYAQPTEDPYNKSISYLERHRILQLFKVINMDTRAFWDVKDGQNLTSDVIYNRPNDPLDFLIREVQQLKQQNEQRAKK